MAAIVDERDLVCPVCRGALETTDAGAHCRACEYAYARTSAGQLDLRPAVAIRAFVECEIGAQRRIDHFDRSLYEAKVPPNPAATINMDDPRWTSGSRLPPAVLSHFPVPSTKGARLLDIGCGDAALEVFATRLGFDYTGIDYASADAPLLGDSRSLPFRNESFEVALFMGVLEHVEDPLLAMAEANRVLVPGGKVVGDVAFGEPYHDNSFFHHSLLGTQSVVERAGFTLDHIGPHPTWNALKASTAMVMLHGIPEPVQRVLRSPVWLTHRLLWKAAHLVRRDDKTSEFHRRHRTAGAFGFVATKTGPGATVTRTW